MNPAQPIEGQDGAVVAASARCKNCGATLFGKFCANCGQSADVDVPTTMELVHELMASLSDSDSRLWRSLLYLWTRPGRLTKEYIAGRRAAYLPPFRLFLVLSVTFFLVASVTPTGGMPIRFDQATGSSAATIDTCDSIKFEGFSRALDLNQRARHI